MNAAQRGRLLRRLAVVVGLITALTGLLHLLSGTRLFRYFEFKSYDTYFSRLPVRPDDRVVLIMIDGKSRRAYPEPMVLWSRHFADLIIGLSKADVPVIGLDVHFPIPLESWLPGHDSALAAAYLQASTTTAVILGYDPGAGAGAPVYLLAASKERVGFLNLTQDQDDYIRRQQLLAPSPRGESYAFAAHLAASFAGREPADLLQSFRPLLDEDRALRIAYRGIGAFRRVSFADAVEAVRRRDSDFLKREFRGRVVLVGTDILEDRHATPLSWASGQRTSGVEIHAHSLSTLLDASPILAVSFGVRLGLLLLALGVTAATTVFRGPFSGALVAGLLVVFIVLTGLLLIRRSLFLSPIELMTGVPAAYSVAGSYRFIVEGRDRRRLRRIFAQYVPESVIGQILAGNTERFAGQRMNLTVLFSDVRGFTTISEASRPEALLAQLNDYFAAMTEIVLRHGGIVDKFIGDGLLALFGAPLQQTDHARRALNAALDMGEALTVLNRRWAAEGRPQFRIGVGLHSGEAVVGNLGSRLKIEYTALGDTVNVASRVESATKEFMGDSMCCVLLSEETLRATSPLPEAEDLGEHVLKGKSRRLRLYKVTGTAKEAAMKAALMAVLGVGLTAQALGQTVGIITQVQGNVSLVLANQPGAGGKQKTRPAMLADVLVAESEIRTAANATATFLYCPRSLVLTVGANSRATLRADGIQTSGSVTSRPLKYCFVPQAAVAPASTQQVGGVGLRGNKSLALLSPGPTTRTPTAPEFLWTPVQAATSYILVVETRDRNPVWQASVQSTMARLPADRSLTPDGVYRLRVMAMKDDEEIASSSLIFRVLPRDEATVYAEKIEYFRKAAVDAVEAGPYLQLALIYEELQDFGAAARAYQQALRFGTSEFIQSRLAVLPH